MNANLVIFKMRTAER